MNNIRRNQLKTEAICQGVWGILGESAETVPAPFHSPLTQPKKQKPAVLSERRNTITERPWKEFIEGSSHTAEKEHFIYGNEQENTRKRERRHTGGGKSVTGWPEPPCLPLAHVDHTVGLTEHLQEHLPSDDSIPSAWTRKKPPSAPRRVKHMGGTNERISRPFKFHFF